MYSESDLQSAVAAGAIDPGAAEALRRHVAQLRALPVADEENVRLVTGFNDIFVAIACLLVIVSGYWGGSGIAAWLGASLVAAASWAMAEVFTRRRRMALPSIILLLAFVVSAGIAAAALAGLAMPPHRIAHTATWDGRTHVWYEMVRHPWQTATMALAGGVAAAVAAVAHWWRFRVAITVAAGTGALVLIVLSALSATTGHQWQSDEALAPAALASGLCVFALAMAWDLSDRERRTQRADIAFWLHLLAAPLIAHPLFHWIGVLGAERIGPAQAMGVLLVYALFAAIALVVDRRALLVSALIYVLAALDSLLRAFGSIQKNLALTTLLIGATLLALSIFWVPLRRTALRLLPARWRERLPAPG